MQIKDLSVAAVRLDDVRGGQYINTSVSGSTVFAGQSVNVGGTASVLNNSPVSTNQQIDASTHASIGIDASESYRYSSMFSANGSSFFSGWAPRRLVAL